jgi:flagellar biosynthesis chaperone FliJ
MKLKLIIAATLLAATPALAQPLPPPGGPQQRMAPPPQQQPQRMAPPPQQQQQKVAKPTEAQVQQVVAGVSADKAKLDSYCKLMKIQQQMGTLDEKKDAKKLQALGQQADAEAQKLGPDFEKMMDGLEQIDENSAEGKKFGAILASLDTKCPK